MKYLRALLPLFLINFAAAQVAVHVGDIKPVATATVLGRATAGSGSAEQLATTGTGAVVQATSPVLVTPNLGTPSTLVATNATGTALGLTAGNAGAVPVSGITGLGTGVATALAVNVGTAGAPVVNGGALGTPSSGVATNLTGTATGLTAGNANAVPASGLTGATLPIGITGAPGLTSAAGGVFGASAFVGTNDARYYGAYSDGSHAAETTAAIQAALTANGSVYLSPGTYLVSGSTGVTLSSNQTIYGAGNTSTILGDGTSGFLIKTATNAERAQIQNIRIIPTGSNAIYFNQAYYSTITNVSIYGVGMNTSTEVAWRISGPAYWNSASNFEARECYKGVETLASANSVFIVNSRLRNCFIPVNNSSGLSFQIFNSSIEGWGLNNSTTSIAIFGNDAWGAINGVVFENPNDAVNSYALKQTADYWLAFVTPNLGGGTFAPDSTKSTRTYSDLTSAFFSASTLNGLALTKLATGFSVAGGTTSKTLTVSNTLTLSGTDGSTLSIGAGGTPVYTNAQITISQGVGSGSPVRFSQTNSNAGGYSDAFYFNNSGAYAGIQIAGASVAGTKWGLTRAGAAYYAGSGDVGFGSDNASGTVSFGLGSTQYASLTSTAFTVTPATTLTGGVTIGSGTKVLKIISATATLDFPSTLAGAVSDLTITVTGAAVGDTVSIGVPNGSVTTTGAFNGWVSATNTVTIRFNHNGIGTEDPASGTFRATVMQF